MVAAVVVLTPLSRPQRCASIAVAVTVAAAATAATTTRDAALGAPKLIVLLPRSGVKVTQ